MAISPPEPPQPAILQKTTLQLRLESQQRKKLSPHHGEKDPTRERPPYVRIATHNVEDARNSRLDKITRNLKTQHIDLAIITELRIPSHNPIHTRDCNGYDIFATYTTTDNQGGIALVTRQDAKNWHVESQLKHGPNVLSCILVSGTQRTPLIGVYLSPKHLNDVPFLVEALERFPNQSPLVLGDLNVDLKKPHLNRVNQVSSTLAAYGLEDILYHFRQRPNFGHMKTWHQKRNGVTIRSRCDYILGTDRRLFHTARISNPRYFTTDHYMISADYMIQPTACHNRYLHGRTAFPLKQPPRPHTKADHLFQEVKANVPPPYPSLKRLDHHGYRRKHTYFGTHAAPFDATPNTPKRKHGDLLELSRHLWIKTGNDELK